MAGGFVRGCCRLTGAVLVVPAAVIIAVLFETPVVTELPVSGAQAEASGARTGEAQTADDNQVSSESQQSVPQRLGSGSMFDRIAFAYDSTNKWMSLGLDQYWRRALVQDCLQLQAGDRVLDLATGTADVGLLVGSRLRDLAGGQLSGQPVLGVDPSAEMLRRGVGKVQNNGLEGVVRLVKGDAQDLSQVRGIDVDGHLSEPSSGVQTGSIDKISMSFGIRNVPDRPRAFREMRRVLRARPSSRVCILEFSLPDGQGFLSRTAKSFITHVVPFIGRVATMGSGSEEYQYLEKSILQFPKPIDFAASMTREGLRVERITSFAFGAVHLYSATPVTGA